MSAMDAIQGLGLSVPIIQAPMAGVSTPSLAAAVSNAGALGSIGIGASTVAQARSAIAETQAKTSRPFNVNVFCHAPAQRDIALESAWLAYLTPLFEELDAVPPAALNEIYASFLGNEEAFRMLVELKPRVVSFHFGLPTGEQVSALRQAGIATIATATSLEEARAIEATGADAIVAQGVEAGGHRGNFDPAKQDEKLPTSVLVRLLVRRTGLPIVAAGGIMDGAGIRAALDLGAVAAQLGTAFILCPESAASDAYRDALKGASAASTRLTATLSGRPARGITNRFIAACEAPGAPSPASYPVAYDAAKQLHALAAKKGIHAFAAHWAGQGAPLAREMPAAELVGLLDQELRATSPTGYARTK
ncbi:nitronate monooxygenase [Xanthomonas campestris]|uniref:NAD(P)H-dependent flavin oxidoreductase n=1 Tax=Xanthomonas campestris TaxID=339 RepID=UPI002E04710C|nr:nitronate monooxygenase [Xanthomonas campestris]